MRATPNDDLAQMLASVPPGEALLLAPGDYRVETLLVESRTLQAENSGVRILWSHCARSRGVACRGGGVRPVWWQRHHLQRRSCTGA